MSVRKRDVGDREWVRERGGGGRERERKREINREK